MNKKNELKEKSVFEISRVDIPEWDFDCSIDNVDYLTDYQGATSYCWMYASVALLKEYIIKKYSLDNFGFSYSYLQFWDKYERMKYAVEKIYKNEFKDEDIVGDLDFLCGDKGDFQIFVSLINKYGIVSSDAMKQTYSITNASGINWILNNYLINLIEKVKGNRQLDKDVVLNEVKNLLESFYGNPPEQFEVNIGGNIKITPTGFYKKYLDNVLNNYVAVGNFCEEYKYVNKVCEYKKRFNFIDERKSSFINLTKKDFIDVVLEQLKHHSTYIALKVTDADLKRGLFHDRLYNFNEVLGVDVELNKHNFIKYKTSVSEHALLLTGVDVKDEKIEKWKIKDNNKFVGKDGYCGLLDGWFDKYVTYVVVDKNILNKRNITIDSNPQQYLI